jgi:hypothetical protein
MQQLRLHVAKPHLQLYTRRRESKATIKGEYDAPTGEAVPTGVAVAEALAQEASSTNVKPRATTTVVLHTTCVTQTRARAAPGSQWHWRTQPPNPAIARAPCHRHHHLAPSWATGRRRPHKRATSSTATLTPERHATTSAVHSFTQPHAEATNDQRRRPRHLSMPPPSFASSHMTCAPPSRAPSSALRPSDLDGKPQSRCLCRCHCLHLDHNREHGRSSQRPPPEKGVRWRGRRSIGDEDVPRWRADSGSGTRGAGRGRQGRGECRPVGERERGKGVAGGGEGGRERWPVGHGGSGG